MLAVTEDDKAASTNDCVELIRKVITVGDTGKQYFSDTQLADLAERREQLGEKTMADAQERWTDLITRVQAAIKWFRTH